MIIVLVGISRSSRPEVFCKKGVLRNFTKFTGKHLCESLFFNKVAGLACNFIKKRLWHRCFPVNFVKFLRTPFFIEHLWWLLLSLCNLCSNSSCWISLLIGNLPSFTQKLKKSYKCRQKNIWILF